MVTEFMSLDGVMEAPGGEPTHPHTGWTMAYSGPEHFEMKNQEMLDAEIHLLGRVTYESFAGAWPTYEGPIADKMNSMQKVVVSSTLTEPTWNNSRVLVPGEDLAAQIEELKQGDGGTVLVAGSATLVRFLLEAGLVDELRLLVFPVSIGGGLRIFPENRSKQTWRQTESVTYPAGVRLDVYVPA